MPEVTKHAPGSFCWIELATTDANAAKRFYMELFGWTVNEIPMGENGFYYMLQKSGRDVGAMYEMYPQMREQGVPPNWMTYVAVESADAAAEKVKSLGGSVVAGPMDVFDSGRMVTCMDPQGSAFAVWEARAHIGLGIRDEDGTLCWNELVARDPESMQQFYSGLFGWKAKVSPEYTEWSLGGQAIGGMMKAGEGMPLHWFAYFQVDDCDATVAQARSMGAQVYVEPNDIPGVGRFAIVADPQGAVFSVIKLQLGAH